MRSSKYLKAKGKIIFKATISQIMSINFSISWPLKIAMFQEIWNSGFNKWYFIAVLFILFNIKCVCWCPKRHIELIVSEIYCFLLHDWILSSLSQFGHYFSKKIIGTNFIVKVSLLNSGKENKVHFIQLL